MGGIVAMFSQRGAVSREVLERATRSLDHRGPDDRQLWVDAARSVGLGHTRLATLDLPGGRQPVANEDESIRAIVDGELYDVARLRDALRARGHRFRTGSDSELVVHLYEEHGAACVEHLRGEVAFVLYDAHRDLLIAARDRCGVKPLVYGSHEGGLLFASEAKALFAAGMTATWDLESLLQSCLLGGPFEDSTMFAGVRRIPAGHLLVATRGHHRLVRYWDFDYPVAGRTTPSSEAEDREALAAALTEAVRLRLRADVPIGCYLGGLDACTVFGLAQRHASAPLPAFTLAYGDTVTEENALAHQLAEQVGAAYTPIRVRQDDLARDLDDAVYAAERPLNNISCVLLFQLSRAVRDAGIQIVLTGEGSDELFAGYAHYRRELALAARAAEPAIAASATEPPPGERPRFAVPGASQAGVPRISMAPMRAALGFTPTWIHVLAASAHGILGLLRPELANRVVRGELLGRFAFDLEISRQLRGRHPVHQSMYLWSKSVLPNYLLSACNDGMQMAHGVECRLPFLDHHVVELSTRLPVDRLIRGGVEKYLLREVARPVVTDAIYRRPKSQVVAPELPKIETRLLDELVHDTLRGSALSATPLFDRGRVVALLDSLHECDVPTRASLNAPLMFILSACLLQQRFGICDAV